jgi:hypothetical protein
MMSREVASVSETKIHRKVAATGIVALPMPAGRPTREYTLVAKGKEIV